MTTKPTEFDNHPLSYTEAQSEGLARGFCRHIVDGDTQRFLIDLGFLCYAYETIRLRGVDTPEIYRPEDDAELERGRDARAFVQELILDKPVLVKSYKDRQTFGRFIADVWYWDSNGDRHSLADTLRAAGFDESEDA